MPTLVTVTRTQGNNRALKEGRVRPAGFDLAFEEVPVLVHAFRRMVRHLEFHVCEMAFTTYLCARAHGKGFTALPIFLVRGFHHGAVVRAVGGGITEPKQLEGRRVGVNRGYTVTTGVWARAILADEHGVDLDKVTWVPSGDDHVAEYRAPANVVPAGEHGDLLRDLAAGDLAAVVGIQADRPEVEPLIPDPEAAGFRALEERDYYPINHLIVVRDDILDEHPDVGPALFDAFAASKQAYLRQLADGTLAQSGPADATYRRVAEITGSDPLPYGVGPNRTMIERLIDHALAQRILDRRPDVESLFASSTLALQG